DIDALTAAGVPLANTAGVNAVAVAEWCLGATLALLRHLHDGDREMRSGGWPQFTLQRRELAGSRVGIVGVGPVGAAGARMFGVPGCEAASWSRTPKAETYGAAYRGRDSLIATSEVLGRVLPRTGEASGLIGEEGRSSMPPGSILVNAAR